MGREQARKGKHLFLYLACFIIILVLGCAHFQKKTQDERRLKKAMYLMINEDYEASLRENRELLRLFPKTLGDKALFQMGLIYAYPKNPNVNYQKSLKCFKRIIKDFPQSDVRDRAKVWVLFLQEIIDKDRKIDLLKRELEERKKRINNLQNQIENLKIQIERLKKIDLRIEEKKREVLPR